MESIWILVKLVKILELHCHVDTRTGIRMIRIKESDNTQYPRKLPLWLAHEGLHLYLLIWNCQPLSLSLYFSPFLSLPLSHPHTHTHIFSHHFTIFLQILTLSPSKHYSFLICDVSTHDDVLPLGNDDVCCAERRHACDSHMSS